MPPPQPEHTNIPFSAEPDTFDQHLIQLGVLPVSPHRLMAALAQDGLNIKSLSVPSHLSESVPQEYIWWYRNFAPRPIGPSGSCVTVTSGTEKDLNSCVQPRRTYTSSTSDLCNSFLGGMTSTHPSEPHLLRRTRNCLNI